MFDTQTFNTGDAFACHCGVTILVRDLKSHDSPVIRCSSCGGSRAPQAKDCTFCGASFTLREHKLTGLCSSCGTRTHGGDLYCHSCGDAIVESNEASVPGDKRCPVCGESHTLTHRQLQTVSLLECVRCGGTWLDRHAFAILAASARNEATRLGARNPRHPVQAPPQQTGPAYRRCVECDQIMQRKNYGRKSGVIVDVCPRHGTWFDLHELEGILAWLRSGGVEVPDPKPAAPRTETITPVLPTGPSGLGRSAEIELGAELFFDLVGWLLRR